MSAAASRRKLLTRRFTEEVLSRTEELLQAMMKKDLKTVRGMLDELAFGQMTDAQLLVSSDVVTVVEMTPQLGAMVGFPFAPTPVNAVSPLGTEKFG